MKTALLFTLCATAMLSCSGQLPVSAAPKNKVKITAKWNFNYGGGVPACGLAGTKNCVNGFQFGEFTSAGCSNLAQRTNPLATILHPTSQQNGISLSVNVGKTPTQPVWCVGALYYDSNGMLALGPVETTAPQGSANASHTPRFGGLSVRATD